MSKSWSFVQRVLGFPAPPYSREKFVERLFPGVEPDLLKGLVDRVTILELDEVGALVTLNEQAALCIRSGALESVALRDGAWESFWHSTAGSVFNCDGLQRKLKDGGTSRVAEPATLLMLSADAFEAELKANPPLAQVLRQRGDMDP